MDRYAMEQCDIPQRSVCGPGDFRPPRAEITVYPNDAFLNREPDPSRKFSQRFRIERERDGVFNILIGDGSVDGYAQISVTFGEKMAIIQALQSL